VPVILVRKGNPKLIQTLRDFLRPDVTLGLGDPQACAIGRASVRIFAKNGLNEGDIQKRVAFRSLTVNELGLHVEVGKIDATIVWDATAAQYADSGEAVPIPRQQNILSTVPVAVLSFSNHEALGEEFAEFVTSERGVQIFKKHHYATELPD
jgi:molybdate transport system substrate-binding protein